MNKIQKTYYWVVFISILVCWSPFNSLAYILPVAVILLILVLCLNEKIISVTSLTILTGFLILTGITIIFNKDFIFQNLLLALLTYSSFFIFLIIPTRQLKNKVLSQRIGNLLFVILTVESLIGFIQLLYGVSYTGSFDGSTGDFVEGTIHLPLPSERSFSNVMFAMNIIFIILYLSPYFQSFSRKRKLVYIAGILIFIFASVVHVTLFLAISIGIAAIFVFPSKSSPTLKHRIFMLLIFLIPASIMFTFLRKNMNLIPILANEMVSGRIPKAQLMYELFTDIPKEYPQIKTIGLGPGQFDSKAALIGTEMYFGSPKNPKDLPLINGQLSPVFKKYVYKKWYKLAGGNNGSTYFPFSSWIAIYGEFGFFTSLGIILFILFEICNITYRAVHRKKRAIGFVLLSGMLLLFFLGFQELYWENPQSIFPGLLLLKLLYSELAYTKKDMRNLNPGFVKNKIT